MSAIDGVVSVQARQTLQETEWLLDLADKHDFIKGVVGWVPLAAPDVRKHLDGLAKRPKLKGVRHIVQDEPDDQFILREDFNTGMRALADYGLVYDILIFERHLPPAIEFVDRHPNQRFVLDHLAKPRVKEHQRSSHGGRTSAGLQNARTFFANFRVWRPKPIGTTGRKAQLSVYLETVLDAFGPHRVMFGSDWPVCLLATSYERWHEVVARFCEKLSADERDRSLRRHSNRGVRIVGWAPPTNFDTQMQRDGGRCPPYAMKAFVIDAPGKTSFADVPEPSPGDGDVLLRVRTVGYCGTDLSTFRGVNPLVSYPRIPGHELGCTIEAIGSAVPQEKFRIGQDVLVHPYKACGRCSACRQQRFNCCRDNETLGVQREGGMTELIAVPWETIYTSDKLSLREMALVEPLTVGYHAVRRGRVTATDTVAVFGCGAIGIGVIAAAASFGATVIAIDVDDRKLELVRKVGCRPHDQFGIAAICTPSCKNSQLAKGRTC